MDLRDVVIIGAGAAGMMCAAEAGKRGRSVLVLEHAESAGKKIRISGGGRCNFTNSRTAPENFLSQNPQFCISALRRYTASDFIALVDRYGIAYHEKTLGQLFCDGSAQQIIDLLLAEMKQADAELRLGTAVTDVEKDEVGLSADAVSERGAGAVRIARRGDGRQVHPQDGRHRFRLPPRHAIRRSRHRDAAGAGAR